ncbi:MAG: DUF1003 domain-containing protein [Oscillospiraceae bacterium]|nr:DUF1003 domain-containing protein [Oscillospiraceae bacterium]
MTKNEKHQLAKKIIRLTNEEVDEEHFIHQLLEESTLYNIYEDDNPSFGRRAADKLARFAGSWAFVISFALFLTGWIMANILLLKPPFDPYPFILLNLLLSCLSALQAPLIMMSQNRQEEKDRKRSEGDYKINLKSEIIIEDMHYKLDAIIARQGEILKYLSDKK